MTRIINLDYYNFLPRTENVSGPVCWKAGCGGDTPITVQLNIKVLAQQPRPEAAYEHDKKLTLRTPLRR